LYWDLSNSDDLSRVGWPTNVPENIWFIDHPSSIEIMLPDVTLKSLDVESIQVYRDDHLLSTVFLFWPAESAEDAQARAVALADELRLMSRDDLDKWYLANCNGKKDPLKTTARITARRLGLPFYLEIRDSYQQDKPWCVSLAFDWSSKRFQSGATTR
jgi:hypothetical protein